MKTKLYVCALWLMGGFYVLAGVMHFVRPENYLRMMPPYIPAPLLMVYLSGVAEAALGMGVLIPRTRRYSAWGLIALLVAVFPANFYMYQQGGAAYGIPDWVLIARLPLQAIFIAWAYVYTRPLNRGRP